MLVLKEILNCLCNWIQIQLYQKKLVKTKKVRYSNSLIDGAVIKSQGAGISPCYYACGPRKIGEK